MMNGAETWPLRKVQERTVDVSGIRMLIWMCGVTKMDKVRDNDGCIHMEEDVRRNNTVIWSCEEKRSIIRGDRAVSYTHLE